MLYVCSAALRLQVCHQLRLQWLLQLGGGRQRTLPVDGTCPVSLHGRLGYSSPVRWDGD